MTTTASTTTNTPVSSDKDKEVFTLAKSLIEKGNTRKTAIKQALKECNFDDKDTSLISKIEIMLDTDDDYKIEAQRPKLKKFDLPFELLFKAGLWKGQTITKKMLDSAVECWKATKANFEPINKFTHKEKKDHQQDPVLNQLPYRLGKLDDLHMRSDELWGRRKEVPEPIVNMMKERLITSHSVEFKPNAVINGKKYDLFLYADALLGSQLPALAPVLEPYYFDAEDYQTVDEYDCESDPILIFEEPQPFQADLVIANKNLNYTEETMFTKEAYTAKVKKFADKGVKVKSYEEYAELEDDKKAEYFKGLEDKDKEKEKFSDDSATAVINAPAVDASLVSENKNLKAQLRKYQEDAEKKAEAEAKLKYEERIEALEREAQELKIKQLQTELKEEQEANEKFIYSMTRNAKGPLLPPSVEGDLVGLLHNLDKDTEKVTYSEGDKSVEGDIKDNVKAVFSKLSREIGATMGINKRTGKSNYSDDEYLETNKKGFGVTRESAKFAGDKLKDATDETITYAEEDDEIQTYADEHNISYEAAFDKFYGTSTDGVAYTIK
jgi:hypothetical protein